METNSWLLILFLLPALLVPHCSDGAIRHVPVPSLYKLYPGSFKFRAVSKRIIDHTYRPRSPQHNIRHHFSRPDCDNPSSRHHCGEDSRPPPAAPPPSYE
ncbi:hypothetical protein V6N13_090594 [Hibiscus sabdariffa]